MCTFTNEYHVLDLLVEQGRCAGVVALCLATGEIHTSIPRRSLFRHGGLPARCFASASNAHSLTGDGMAVVYRRGIPLEDMEFSSSIPRAFTKWDSFERGGAR